MGQAEIEVPTLRQEIIEYSGRITSLARYSIVGSMAVVGLALSSKSNGVIAEQWAWVVAISPLFFLWPMASLALSHQKQIARIAAYLNVMYAKVCPYEHLLHKMRCPVVDGDVAETQKPPSWPWGTIGPFLISGCVCIIVGGLLAFDGKSKINNNMVFIINIFILLCVGWAGFSYWAINRALKLRSGGPSESGFLKEWTTLVEHWKKEN